MVVGQASAPQPHMAAKKSSRAGLYPCDRGKMIARRQRRRREGNGEPRGLKLIICPAFTSGSEEEATAMSALLWTWPGIADNGKA